MQKRLRIVIAFAAVGFVLPWLIALYCEVVRRLGGDCHAERFLYVCPTLIWLMATENASRLATLEVWMLIGLTNAALYSIVGVLASVFVPQRN
jgi:uncharacterized membrane protein YfhO